MMPTRYPEMRRLKPGEQHFYPTPDTTDRAGLQKRINSAMRLLVVKTGRKFKTYTLLDEDGVWVRRVA